MRRKSLFLLLVAVLLSGTLIGCGVPDGPTNGTEPTTEDQSIIWGEILIVLNEQYPGRSLADLLDGFFDEFEVIEIRSIDGTSRKFDKDDPLRSNAPYQGQEVIAAGQFYAFELASQARETTEAAIRFLLQNPHIRYAEPNFMIPPPNTF